MFQFLQNEGKKRTNTAKSSNLPNNIPNERIHLETSGIFLQFPSGPIIPPRPGPTFDIALAAPEIEVKKSNPEIERSIAIIKKIIRKKNINIITELIKPSEIF